MSSRANTFLALAVLGAVAPAAILGVFVAQEGLDLGELGDQLGTTGALAVFADLSVSSIVFLTWAAFQAPAVGVRWWPFLLANLFVGLSFALPLFLYYRERGREPAAAPAPAAA